MSYKSRGYITLDELREKDLIPSMERLRKGPIAIAECPEEIPCNICANVCPFHAIRMDKIYDIPRIDPEKCIGCGVCVPQCPGLAIFIVDLSKPGKALITLPYEFLPPPEKGMRVQLLDRRGEVVGEGVIVKAWEYDKTWAVTVEVPEDKWGEVRMIRIPRR
jgi:Fe-S-cluster-containing hydrogenase component 2